MSLLEIADRLEKLYGRIKQPLTDPFEIILAENAAYLVDDARRIEVFRRLRDRIGTDPEQILDRNPNEIEAVIAGGGGMLPEHRANKVMKAARVAAQIGLDQLRDAIATDARKARKLLKEFPGVGDPLADKILLFNNVHSFVAPDSNALRVLSRLGYGEANEKNYSKWYKSAISATTNELKTPKEAQRAHVLLRHHGQELCKRSEPRCELCPLRDLCVWYKKNLRGGARS